MPRNGFTQKEAFTREQRGQTMNRIFLVVSTAAVLASTTYASAQVWWDDPPGWAFQRRGIIEESGRNPNRFGFGYAYDYGAYGAYGAYDDTAVVVRRMPRRFVRPDNPPGSRFQNRGIDDAPDIHIIELLELNAIDRDHVGAGRGLVADDAAETHADVAVDHENDRQARGKRPRQRRGDSLRQAMQARVRRVAPPGERQRN